MSEAKLICNNVWKIFGSNPKRVLNDHDHSKSRAEIQAETGHVVAAVSYTHPPSPRDKRQSRMPSSA